MARARNGDIEIEYETFGSPDNPTLLVVCGFTSQMTTGWQAALCERFVDAGFHVVRYDNRDVGLSTHLDGVPVDVGAALLARGGKGPMPPVPYRLSEMAADGIAVLDALGVDRAHIAGVSMGGMIVQTMAIEHPTRIASLTSIMSTTGEAPYGRPTKEANAALLSPPPADRATFISQGVDNAVVWASPRYCDRAALAERLASDYDRMFYPEGNTRQLTAILASGDRAEGLRNLDVPTLVIHGRADTLIGLSGGERTAELVAGASLLVLNDMGHDLPVPLWPEIVDAITAHARRAG
jgi:pimeloyl-ACP methyl ester carboxylesterase